MLRHLLPSILFFFGSSLFGQKNIAGTPYTHFQISLKQDTIDFIVADTNLNTVKPALLFCQGSQPIPLFVNFEDYGNYATCLANFDLAEINEHFHVVVISMPKTPLIANLASLNSAYSYITDSTDEYSYDPRFVQSDYLQNYANRGNQVIKFLIKQKNWVDKTKLVIAGHSQGARIAVEIASKNKTVTHLGLFGYNPLGRMTQIIWSHRKNAEDGKITWSEADSLQKKDYQFYELILNKDSSDQNPALQSWASFSVSSLEQLAELKIPVYIAYGTEDIVTDFNDIIPLYFIGENKQNYALVRYENLEHNFFPIIDGRVDYEKGQWKHVMNTFISWTMN